MKILENKKRIITVVVMVLLLVIMVLLSVLFAENDIKQLSDTITHEAGQELEINPYDHFDIDEKEAEQFAFDLSKVDTNMVGEYDATVFYKNKEYSLNVKVVDTTAPKTKLSQRYLFTNDISAVDVAALFESIDDMSEYNITFAGFGERENLKLLDERALEELVASVSEKWNEERLQEFQVADVPIEQGLYRSLLEVADIHGNTTYEEIYVILDTTGARIEDVPDKVITVSSEDLSKEPEVDKSEYIITDNVDGKADAEQIDCTLELKAEAEHEWLVHVSHTDRAGNESKADFLIIVKEEAQDTESNTENENVFDNNSSNDNSNRQENTSSEETNTSPEINSETVQGGNADDNSSSNQNSNANNENSVEPEEDNRNTENDSPEPESETVNKPTNNQDVSTWVPTDDENDISPYEQMVIDAGYGVVVEIDDNVYAVLTHGDGNTEGKYGGDILREYLAERDLEPQNVSGGWIDSENDWYWYIAENLRELITPEDEEFWD